MITFTEFSAIFRGTDFTEEELRKFYYSVKKFVILRLAGRRAWPEIFKLEEKCQWPLLRMVDDPALSIYEGAEKVLLERFIHTISEEKKIRERKPLTEKTGYWTLLRSVIDERIALFTQIFDFCKSDMRRCEMVAERYTRIIEKRTKQRKRMWQVGIGTGAATLAGAATLWYISKKDWK